MRKHDDLFPHWDYQPIPYTGNLLKFKVFPLKYIQTFETSSYYFQIRKIKYLEIISGNRRTVISCNLQKDIINL